MPRYNRIRDIQSRKKTALDGNMYNPYVKELIDLAIVGTNISHENLIPFSKATKIHSQMVYEFMRKLPKLDEMADSCIKPIGYADKRNSNKFAWLDSIAIEFVKIIGIGINDGIMLGNKKNRMISIAKQFAEGIEELKQRLEDCEAKDIRMVANKGKPKQETKRYTLPLVILRPAISISLASANKKNRVYPNSQEISSAIAIATANAQKSGYLYPGSRELTPKGMIKEKEHEEKLDDDKLALFEHALFLNRKKK